MRHPVSAVQPTLSRSSSFLFTIIVARRCSTNACPTYLRFSSGLLNLSLRTALQLRHVSGSGANSIQQQQQQQLFLLEDEDEDEEEEDEDEDENEDEEEAELLVDEFDPSLYLRRRKSRRGRTRRGGKRREGPVDASLSDWAEGARQRALVGLEARNPRAAEFLKRKLDPQAADGRKKKAKKKKKNIPQYERIRLPINNRGGEGSAECEDGALRWGKSIKLGTLLPQKGIVNLAFTSHNSDEQSQRERALNRRLVESNTSEEVLAIVFSAEERTRMLGRVSSPLSPLNAATALHRIAKHMETSQMPRTDRITFARRPHMAELVGRSMDILAGCSAQGLSNIAWALSKVGGSTLYIPEMDHIAEHASTKVADFNAQNVANMTGAFACMQHSAPTLFSSLARHASQIVEDFKMQELAQVLWSFAELFQPADHLFDALDHVCSSSDFGRIKCTTANQIGKASGECEGKSLMLEEFSVEDSARLANAGLAGGVESFANLFDGAKLDHLVNLSWSYAVLNQLSRPSFRCLWETLEFLVSHGLDDNYIIGTLPKFWHLSQIHQVNLCLHYEYPQLEASLSTSLKGLAKDEWEKHKCSLLSTSAYEKDLQWLLGCSGKNWVTGYSSADYSLDLALVDEKMALEFDGPSHFCRNTGSPLGHTVLKRRLLTEAGWKVFPIPYTQWEELDGEVEQAKYLDNLLKSEPWQAGVRE